MARHKHIGIAEAVLLLVTKCSLPCPSEKLTKHTATMYREIVKRVRKIVTFEIFRCGAEID